MLKALVIGCYLKESFFTDFLPLLAIEANCFINIQGRIITTKKELLELLDSGEENIVILFPDTITSIIKKDLVSIAEKKKILIKEIQTMFDAATFLVKYVPKSE